MKQKIFLILKWLFVPIAMYLTQIVVTIYLNIGGPTDKLTMEVLDSTFVSYAVFLAGLGVAPSSKPTVGLISLFILIVSIIFQSKVTQSLNLHFHSNLIESIFYIIGAILAIATIKKAQVSKTS